MNIIEALVQLRDDLKLWVANNLVTKVDKEEGKGLSSNDFTTAEKEKLASIDLNDLVEVDAELSETSENSVQNKVITQSINNLAADAKLTDNAIKNLEDTKVPVTRTINGKALNSDIVLTSNDIDLSDYAKASALEELEDLIGTGGTVSDQIETAIDNLQIEKEIYIQDDEPTDVADGTVWIDRDAEHIVNGNVVSIPTVTTADNGKFMMVVNGYWAAVEVPNGEGVEF